VAVVVGAAAQRPLRGADQHPRDAGQQRHRRQPVDQLFKRRSPRQPAGVRFNADGRSEERHLELDEDRKCHGKAPLSRCVRRGCPAGGGIASGNSSGNKDGRRLSVSPTLCLAALNEEKRPLAKGVDKS